MSTLTVLDPTGYPPKIAAKALAPRLDTLNGRTVYLVDDPKTWEEIRARGHAAILGVGH